MKNATVAQGLIAILIGAISGLYFYNSTQDVWFGGVIGIVVCISIFGLGSFFDVLFPWGSNGRTGWNLLFALLLVVLIGTPQASSVIQTVSLYGTILLLMGVLISGATIGIAIARNDAFSSEPD